MPHGPETSQRGQRSAHAFNNVHATSADLHDGGLCIGITIMRSIEAGYPARRIAAGITPQASARTAMSPMVHSTKVRDYLPRALGALSG